MKLEDVIEIKDITTKEDDPYDNWKTTPYTKFIEELTQEGYTYKEIYNIDYEKEENCLAECKELEMESPLLQQVVL